MRWLRAFLVLAILVICGIALYVVFQNSNVSGWDSTTTIAALVFFLIASLTFIAVVFLLLFIPARIIDLVFSQPTLFGHDTRARLASLSIATILFPTGIAILIVRVVNAFLTLVNTAFGGLQSAQANLSSCVTSGLIGDCVSYVGFGFIDAWIRALTTALERINFNTLPYGAIFLWLIVWLATAAALSSLSQNLPQAQSAQSRLSRWFAQPHAVKNLIFLVLLLLSGYLSLVSIIAIPDLQRPVNIGTDITPETLESRLTAINTEMTLTAFASLGDNPLQNLNDDLAENPDQQAAYGWMVTRLANEYSNAEAMVTRLSERAVRERQQSIGEAVGIFEGDGSERKGVRETTEHYQDLIAWYRDRLDGIDRQLSDCTNRLENLHTDLISYAENAVRSLSDTNAADPRTAADVISNGFTQFDAEISDLDARCRDFPSLADAPARPDLGSFLGVFGLVAGWLLESESLAMGLIVGLVGFGLLGATASTLVRERVERRSESDSPAPRPYVDDLVGVIVRGVSSAMVVFLAAQGGLALLSTEEVAPNPYVLLLLCLVSAVFSEAVWNGAQHWLLQRMENFAPGSSEAVLPMDPLDSEPGETGDGANDQTEQTEDTAIEQVEQSGDQTSDPNGQTNDMT